MSDEEFLGSTMAAMDLVYNIARRVVPTKEDAEDLVQETYLAAYRAWRDHRRPRKVEPWLATICLNLARSRHRYRARRPQELPWDEMGAFESDSDPARSAEEAVERETVHRALWSLSEEQRTVVSLVDLAGFTTTEAAKIMHTPRGTVLSRLHRGRKALSVLLGDRVREEEDLEP